MTENQVQNQEETKVSDKEMNFRRLEAKAMQAERELMDERQRRQEMERRLNEISQREEVEEETDEPYVDHKKLDKKLNKFGQNTKSEIKNAMVEAKELAKEELKQEFFLENHSDFFNVLEYSEKFAEKHPKLADNILKMPQGFERQKLVYQMIKELGMDKPQTKEQTIQEKIDSNKRSPYYMPSGVGTAPYQSVGDYSAGGQEQAYKKMQELKSRLRL